jgi:hypothetical protein
VLADIVNIANEDERTLAKAILEQAAASALSSAEIKQLLAEGAARTAAQVERLDTALPTSIEWRTIVDGVRTTYAQARRARKAAKRSRHAFHTWRRRCKELAIQIDVIEQVAGPQLEPLREGLLSITSDLGDTVDLLMARDFVRTHCEPICDEGAKTLTRAIELQLDEKIREGRRSGRDAFRRKPRALARKLAKATRPDVTPVAAPPLARAEEFAMT